jgi:hypothetical protein
LPECIDAIASFRIVLGNPEQRADLPHRAALLRARRERPKKRRRGRPAGKNADEIAASHVRRSCLPASA